MVLPNSATMIDCSPGGMEKKHKKVGIRSKEVSRAATAIAVAIGLAGAGLLASRAQSIDYDQGRYQNQLLRLSEILGHLHHCAELVFPVSNSCGGTT